MLSVKVLIDKEILAKAFISFHESMFTFFIVCEIYLLVVFYGSGLLYFFVSIYNCEICLMIIAHYI
jgi:hypothetical protein